MLDIIEYSVMHFCEHILKLHIKQVKDINGELYGASIPITKKDTGEEYSFYLFFSKEVLKKFADVLINDNKFNEDDWTDLVKECANQIIGYAKNLLNDKSGKDIHKLGIPEYLGKVDFSSINLDQSLTYELDNHCFRIGYKKI